MLKSPVIVTGPASVQSVIISCLLFEFPGSPLTLAEGAMYELASTLYDKILNVELYDKILNVELLTNTRKLFS